MVSPLIGVSSECVENGEVRVRHDYVTPFARLGCVPVVIPSVECNYAEAALRLARILDGLVLTGGGDIDPAHFGQRRVSLLTRVSKERDGVELAMARAFLEMDKPILGICRGAQVLNVAAGGTLIQDIPTQVQRARSHRLRGTGPAGFHPVTIEAGTILYGIVGERTVDVNSRHHQSVDVLAPGFVVSARAADGVIEGIEAPGRRFVVAVQWHPEDLCPRKDAEALFRAFVDSCREGTK